MIAVVLIGLAFLAILFIGVRMIKAGPRHEPGVVSFRKHIDALSPEARREVMDRVRPPQNDHPDGSK
ncbi:MAG: hypothetical protein Q7V62_10425 [Actinomycetota bacterium]|nr:hypothetical protein [Actinomycetota bacterium]MDP2292532.1 hypothetical protein [Actinomycetota bacterium]